MDVQALKSLYENKIALEALQAQLDDFDGLSGRCISETKSLAKSNPGYADRTLDLICRRDSIRREIVKRYEGYLKAVEQGNRILDGIANETLRAIFYYHDCQGCRWAEVAKKIGGNATADSVKKSHERYLETLSMA